MTDRSSSFSLDTKFQPNEQLKKNPLISLFEDMNPLVDRQGFKIESTVSEKKKKNKEKKSKPIENVHIIDDDAPIPWNNTVETQGVVDEELVSFDDAPVVVGVVDDRPAELREKDRLKDVKRWRATAFEEVPDPDKMGPQLKPTKPSKNASRKAKNSSDDSDPDLDRPRRIKEDPDLSPPRRRNRSDDDPSPPRRKTYKDPSPPRRKIKDEPRSSPSRERDSSPPRHKQKHHRHHRDSSPPARKRYDKDDDPSPPRRRETSSHHHRDRSPRESSSHRRQVKEEPQSPAPPRRSKQRSSPSPSPPPQTATQPAKSERRRLAEHKEQLAERYATWGRGLAQVRQTEEAAKDYIEQAEKPLARYRDDSDLDAMLKEREREDDPMLKYLTKKPSEQGGHTNDGKPVPAKPRYRGPDPQKNRFDIWPGYRWDGVDRSNGYERKLFETIANRHAKAQEAYLWSVEDM